MNQWIDDPVNTSIHRSSIIDPHISSGHRMEGIPPLQGIRVIDLTRVLAGPFCTMLLGDMGAEVLKIEEPRHGDETRAWPPLVEGSSAYFRAVNRSKKSVALDLKTAAGRDVLERLIERADVLVENFRPGSLSSLGFGYEDVAAINPRLVYCSISGYGQSGPRSRRPGYDVVIQGESGLMDVTGFPDGEPTRVGIAVTDYLAGLYAVQGILLALIERQRSGKGQQIDLALYDSMLSVMHLPVGILLATGEDPGRFGNDHPSIAPYETIRARDGAVIVAVGNPRLWLQFCDALGRQDLCEDPRFRTNAARLTHRDELRAALQGVFDAMGVDELIQRLEAHNVPCGKLRSVREALEDPQVAARDMLLLLEHPIDGTAKVLGNPIKLSRTPSVIRQPPPRLGEHTAEVVSQLKFGP
jgi:crotonobetainyl-CoA:carnitine CoA-transferase CaiB-like acyl-CoA transferase